MMSVIVPSVEQSLAESKSRPSFTRHVTLLLTVVKRDAASGDQFEPVPSSEDASGLEKLNTCLKGSKFLGGPKPTQASFLGLNSEVADLRSFVLMPRVSFCSTSLSLASTR